MHDLVYFLHSYASHQLPFIAPVAELRVKLYKVVIYKFFDASEISKE